MPPQLVLATGFTFNSGGLLGSCFFYLFSGMIAGTVASFVVRGKMGCIFGNFFLGILGAIIANFLLNLVLNIVPFIKSNQQLTTGFLGTTILASIAATLISYTFTTLRKAESRYQKRLIAESQTPPPSA